MKAFWTEGKDSSDSLAVWRVPMGSCPLTPCCAWSYSTSCASSMNYPGRKVGSIIHYCDHINRLTSMHWYIHDSSIYSPFHSPIDRESAYLGSVELRLEQFLCWSVIFTMYPLWRFFASFFSALHPKSDRIIYLLSYFDSIDSCKQSHLHYLLYLLFAILQRLLFRVTQETLL